MFDKKGKVKQGLSSFEGNVYSILQCGSEIKILNISISVGK